MSVRTRTLRQELLAELAAARREHERAVKHLRLKDTPEARDAVAGALGDIDSLLDLWNEEGKP